MSLVFRILHVGPTEFSPTYVFLVLVNFLLWWFHAAEFLFQILGVFALCLKHTELRFYFQVNHILGRLVFFNYCKFSHYKGHTSLHSAQPCVEQMLSCVKWPHLFFLCIPSVYNGLSQSCSYLILGINTLHDFHMNH